VALAGLSEFPHFNIRKGKLSMNYCSRTTVESKLYPGVTFVVNRMNERRRVRRELGFADLRLRVNEQQTAIQEALKEKDSLPPGRLEQMNASFGELLHGEWYPAWIRWGILSIDGLEIDGVKATVQTLCEDGPTDLVEEVFAAVMEAAGLSTVEEKNSESPGTSEGQADGKTIDSIAPSAGLPAGGESETVQNSTQGT
jgi:hypothetical protein